MAMKIVVGMDLTEEQRRAYIEAATGCEVAFVGMGGITAETAADADMVIGNPPHMLIPKLKNMKALQLFSAGNDGYDAAIQQLPGARVYNASGAFGLTLSEHMLATLMMLMRKLHLYRDAQPNRGWSNFGSVRSIMSSKPRFSTQIGGPTHT